MDFSVSAIFASVIFGIVGMYVFRYGKQKGIFAQMIFGISLMVYPYFVSGVLLTWAIGVLLLIAVYLFR